MLSVPRSRSEADPAAWVGCAALLRMVLVLLCAAWTSGCASVPHQVERQPSHAWGAPEQTSLGRLSAARREQAKARADSAFHLLDGVDEAYTGRLALIERAQRTLDLQYYAVHADASTEVMLERLRAAAGRGVRVRVLLDDFNTAGADAQVLRLAFVRNVELRLFNPVSGSRQSILTRVLGSLHQADRLQKRMHNKLFIADNAWGITGGRNLGDAYFGGDEHAAFVDLDVLATGRIVRDMSASFDRYWNDELAYPVQALLDAEQIDRLRRPAAESRAADGEVSGTAAVPSATAASAPPTTAERVTAPAPPTRSATVLPNVTPSEAAAARRAPMDLQRVPLAWAPSVLLVDKPGKVDADTEEGASGETVIDGLLGLIAQARKEVLVISPYFVPGEQMLRTLAEARRRGVVVRVLTNSLASNDAPAAHAGYARWRPRLLEAGIELYEMRADASTAVGLEGSGAARSQAEPRQRRGIVGSGPGGSKGGSSRASLHSKAVIIDRNLSVIGSMNLDLRSQLKNSEVALAIRSGDLAQSAATLIERSFAESAYRVQLRPDGDLVWKAPPGASFTDATREPDASLKLRLLVNLLGPLAPDAML